MANNNPSLVVAIGSSNARSSRWCISNKSNYEGIKVDCFATQYDIKQLINKPMHLRKNCSSCIDLIFTSQPNLVMAKFNLKIHYSLPYEGEVWHYKRLIRKTINEFNWQTDFFNLNINEMVSVCNKTIKNIMENFILHETIICDDKDPSWINNRIKQFMNEIVSTRITAKIMVLTFLKNQRSCRRSCIWLSKDDQEESKDIYYSNLSTKLVKQKPKS